MKNSDLLNLNIFYGMKIYFKTISGKIIGIPSKIKKVQDGKFETKEEFQSFMNTGFISYREQFYIFKIQIEDMKKTNLNNNIYNFELINHIYTKILEILELLKKFKTIEVHSENFDSKDIQYQELMMLRDFLEKVIYLKTIEYSKVLNGNFIKTKAITSHLNPLNWIKKS
jgi:hypothetical protein